MNQDLVLAVALPLVLFGIMFAMGCNLKTDDFKRVGQHPRTLLTGMVSQMVLLPLLAFILLTPMGLSREILIGFMILALSPGGTTSNMFSFLLRGNLALSISLTAIVSLLTPVTIPLLAGFILQHQAGVETQIALPFGDTFLKLLTVTLIPVLLGMTLRHYRPGFCDRHQSLFTRISMLALFLVILGIIFQNWQQMPFLLEQTALPALLLATLALFSGYLFARLCRQNRADARTIAIETSIQNGGTAILVTGTILQNPAMTIAPVMYGILMLAPAILSVSLYHRLAPAELQQT